MGFISLCSSYLAAFRAKLASSAENYRFFTALFATELVAGDTHSGAGSLSQTIAPLVLSPARLATILVLALPFCERCLANVASDGDGVYIELSHSSLLSRFVG